MRSSSIYVILVTICCCGISAVNGQDDKDVAEGATSLAFVFDITGSMYDDLVQVIEGAAKILATTLSRREKPLHNYVLVPFHDPVVGPVVVTTDPDDFQHELRNLYVQGGGDCPEMSISAIKEAIDVSLPNSFIYVFTDARSKDFHLTEEVLAMIQKKQSQVVFVLTGDCDDPRHEGYIAYEQIASTSSGQVFLLKKSQVNEVLNFVRVAVQSRKVNLMAVDIKDTNSNVFTIPIDSKLQEITISVSGSKPKISLTDPSGNRFTPRKGLKKLLDIRNALVVNVKEPQPGIWKMNVEANGQHTIRVTGLSTTDFVAGFSRKPADDIKETEHRPIGGVATHVLVNASDLEPPAGFSQLHLVDLFGNTLAEYPLIREDDDPNIYTLPSFVPPEIFFYVKVSGIDDKGFRIERQTPTAITRIVPGPPELKIPEVTRGYFGLTAVLVCQVDSLVPYTVQWFKEDVQQGPELYFLESGNVSLEIPGANQFAEGIYFCKATNTAGTRQIPTFLDVSEPPPSITSPQNVSVLPGDNAVLTCNVFSAVDFNLTWHRTGFTDRLRTSQKFVDFNNGSLLVRNVQLEDEGKYVCRAMNEGGKAEKSAYIRVQVAPLTTVIPETVSFAQGDKREIICTAKGFPEPEINWLRDRQRIIVNEKVQLIEGKLILLNMNRGDEGEYICLASNPAGDSTARVQLSYIESPHITNYDSKVLVAAGDEAVLFCAAEGIPPPEIEWYKGDVQLKALSYVQISNDGRLTIVGAQNQDAGEYQCVAKNEAGSDSAIVLLEVGSEPKITDGPENTGEDIGGNTTLVCRADGLPTPKVFWQRQDGRKLDHGGRVKQLPSGDLFIQNLGVSDEGSYVCVAQNQFGTTQMVAYLTITGIVPPLIGYMDPIIQVVQGEDVELNCQVLLGNPVPKVQWLFNGQTVDTDGHITKYGDGNVYIKDVQDFHSGDYLCLASNVGGNASFIVTLQVQVPPSFDYISPEDEQIDFNINQGDTVVLPCNVQGDPLPIITWFKDESPISLTDYHYLIREDGSLEIYSAEAVDTGVYRCEARNEAGLIDKVLNLFVQVAPSIGGDPNERIIVIENGTATLQCVASGVPHPDISWRKNFVPFSPISDRFLQGNFGMTISETQIEDKAIYECIASNVAGEETKIITLIVQIPPKILGKGDSDITVLKGEKVILNCENTGDPTPTVDWKKDETVLSVFGDSDGFEETDEGLLVIESARVFHTGRYVCVVENDAGLTTRDFVLSVQEPPSLPLNLTTYKDVIEDNPVILQCPAVGTPIPLITWYKDGVLITGDQIGIIILEDGSLEISETEASDSAVYTCIAENQAGEVKHEVEVKVIVPPRLTGKDQGQEGVVDNPSVIVYENVTLVCPVEADPQPVITWHRNGYELNLSELDVKFEVSPDGMNLTLFNADVSDTARYTCIAENEGGEIKKSFDLDVLVPPAIDKEGASPEENIVVKDNSLYLDCPVSGIPAPTVYWYKDGERISPEIDTNIHIHANGRRLEIKTARVTDTGKYTCVGENEAGSSEQNFDVDVHVPPKIEGPGEIINREIFTNDSVSLTCPAAGIPLPEIIWYKNSQVITANNSQYTLLNDGWTLEIVSANVADSARYTCKARNRAGEGEKAFDLNVLVPPKIQRESMDLEPKVVLNQSVIINCLVEGKPSPTILWYKNGIQLDASIQPRYEILSGGRQLRVKQAQLSDAATFQCVAQNKAGTDSVDFKLKVLVPARIDLRRPNNNPKVVVNGNVTIVCPATGVPRPTIVWFKSGEVMDASNLENIRITNDGQDLTIYGAQVEDTAVYTCRASNEAGESDISYQVDVQVPPSINEDEVTRSPHVVLDKSVVLNCPVVGVPKPDIVWMKGGQPIDYRSHQHYTVEADGQRLSIQRSKLSDADVFTCIAANEAGSLEQNYELDVWVSPKIDGKNLELNTTVNKGYSRVLFCPVEGNPVPDILWLKDNEPVQLDSRVEVVNDGLQLKITNATVADTGRYTCVARNPAGQDSLSYDLKVFVPPSIDESNVVYFRKVVENRTIIIECPVSGIPTPTVDWLIDEQAARPRDGLRFSHNNYHLELASAQVTDSAIYTCIASNDAGELRKKFHLEVQVPPKVDLSKLEKEMSVIQNRSRVILCPVTGIPEPSIIWYKDGTPLLDWPYPRLTLREKSLEIVSAQIDDAGDYKCQATNPAGQIKLNFKMHVYVPPHISESHIVTPVSVTKGMSVEFVCEATGIPEPQLAWIKDGENIEIVQNPHIRIQKKGQFLQITNSEITDAGRYICHAENRAGIAERMFDLEVNVPATILGVEKGTQNVWVTINDPLTLECPAEGIPPPSITWRRQGQFIHEFGSPGLRIQDDGRKLLIVSAQLLDLGDYTCYVENVAGNSTLEYFVNVYVPPTIEKGVDLVEAVVNFGAILPCESLGLPDPVVTWEKNNEKFPVTGLRHRMRVSGTMEFTSVRLEDAGSYKCTATNDAGNATREVRLDVQVPPRMVGRQPLYLDTVKGEGILLPCDVTGVPSPRILWQKGTKVVRGGPGIEVIENGSLYLQRTSETDAGVYICIAQNSAGTAFGQIRLRIYTKPVIDVKRTDFIINNAQNIVLPCQATGRPRPKITWEKDGEEITRSNAFLRLIRTGLAIPFARPEDAGIYTCIATNEAGSARQDMKLLVQVPPQIEEGSRLLTFTVGETADIKCESSGIPPPVINWLKEGRDIDSSLAKYQISSTGSLLIRSLTEDDTGSYICTASNIAGQATQERLLRIQVPPSFVVVPQIKEVLLDQRLELRCTADGIPTPTIYWKRNDIPVQSQPSVNGRSFFILHNVRPEDGGLYTCIAQNPAGQAEVNTMVTVKVPAEILTPPGNKAVTIAERVILTCSVGGDPPPEVIWMKNGRPVRLTSRIQQLSNGSLVIFDSTSSDAGEYKCVATNDAGTSEGVAMLTVREPPTFLIEPHDTKVIRGENLLVDCVGIGEPEPKMDWMMGWDILQDKGRLSILPNNSLRILAAQLSDSGTYRCLAGNNLGKTFVEINITVLEHGGWSVWGDFGDCSVSCEGGVRRRFRTCSNPPPANGGRPCIGSAYDTETCSQVPCPVDGMWFDWSDWSPCSRTCDHGTRQRVRTCQRPKHGGLACRGDNKQVMDCLQEPCYAVPTVAEGNLIGYINNMDIPGATFTLTMTPDTTSTHINATIRNVPTVLVPHFRHLLSVLSPVYWTTAKEIDGAYNGYSLTDGLFTREELIQYMTGEILKASHYSRGVDDEGKLQLDIVLQGNVPDITDSQTINVTPYWEQYTQSGQDTVHVGSTRLMNIDGFPLLFASNQSILYNKDDTVMPYLVQRMYATNLKVDVFPDRQLVNFAVDTSISPGSPSNQCPDGFILHTDGQYCLDDEECLRLGPCSHYCHNSVGSFYCSCPTGYTLDVDGRQCVDVDECNTQSAGCSRDQECTNTIGSFFCHVKCSRGYRPSEDGQNCIDIDECEESTNVCDQICVNKYGGYRCRCMPGYRRVSKGKCIDIDECELTNPPCEQVCANAHGSYLCSCRQGFELVSRGRCTDVNECKTGIFSCSGDQTCVNSVGSYKCIAMCPKGSTFSDGKCEDINECVTGKHRCYYNQKCVNTDPGYRCICPRGYRSAGPGTPCLDIDECSEMTALCSYKCENTYGDYECICSPGQVRLADRKSCAGLEFLEPAQVIDTNIQQRLSRNTRHTNLCPLGRKYSPQSGQCIDINECMDDPGICQHNCTNTVGSYECTCPPGYRVSKDKSACEDINECVENEINCGPDKMCFNTLGEFTCINIPCPKGYQRDPITSNCVLECIDAEIACPDNARYADVIEFRTLALPSGVVAEQRLIRLTAYNQNNDILRNTVFKIIENDDRVVFYINLEDGIGIVYTQQPLEDSHLYKIKVQAKSFDNEQFNIQYQTTFLIHIAVSAYPY